jgi:hypothetical protein
MLIHFHQGDPMASRKRKAAAKRGGATRRAKALVRKVRRAVGAQIGAAKRSAKARKKSTSRRVGARKAAAKR